MNIHIQSNCGIGDLLLLTPSFRVIKEAYPECRILVSSQHRELLAGNPFVFTDTGGGGFPPTFPDPHSGITPVQHHILSLWMSLCSEFGLTTEVPNLRPELYINGELRYGSVLVQVLHRRQWGGKKAWPYFRELVSIGGFGGIPKMDSLSDLVRVIRGASLVICAEGLVSHIAAAVGTKAIVIFGGFLKPEWNGYLEHINLTSDICSVDCYNSQACENNLVCMKDISIERVLSYV